MKSRLQREQELLSSGLVDSIRGLFQNSNANIPEKYYLLMTDYIDSISQLDYEGGLCLDSIEIARSLPLLLNSILEENLGVIHGITNGKQITMNSSLDYETNKLYFFHELTHALQTRYVNNHEECSFYNGKTGMFLTEGATQFTAEILYHLSNETNLQYRKQPNTVRGHAEHIPYSPLSEYQLNGNILMLLSGALKVSLNQLLALGFKSNGRQLLKEMYESFPSNVGKFEEFMFDLEKIYGIDKLIIIGQGKQLEGDMKNIKLPCGQVFSGNIKSQGEIINKIERSLASNFIANNDANYILQNYQKISMYLTTPQLQQEFMNVVNELTVIQNNQIIGQSSSETKKS